MDNSHSGKLKVSRIVELHLKKKETQEWESCHDAVAKMLDYDVEVSEFELQSFYYVHLGKIGTFLFTHLKAE